MKILIFSDIHGDIRALENIVAQPADIYIAAGDLSTFGKGLDRCGEVLKPLGERLWVLPGNHETHEETRAFCKRYGFVDFHRQVRHESSRANTLGWPRLQQHHAVQHARRIFRRRNRRSARALSTIEAALSRRPFPPATARSSTSTRRETCRQPRAARLGRTRQPALSFLRPHPRNCGTQRSPRRDAMHQRGQARLHVRNLSLCRLFNAVVCG